MSLQQFINKWLGGRTDYDKVYAYQCVDLILQYLAECWGITSGVWGNAIDYWTKPTARLLQDFDKVGGTPQAGDIVILQPTSTNPYGHIMIAVNSTTAIEQNGATGDGDGQGGDEIRYRTIPTARIAGLLRKKGTNMNPNRGDVDNILGEVWGRSPNPEDYGYTNQSWHDFIYGMLAAYPWQNRKADFTRAAAENVQLRTDNQTNFNIAEVRGGNFQRICDATGVERKPDESATTDQIIAVYDALKKGNVDIANKLAEQVKIVGIKDNEITRLSKENESLKAQVGDNSKWETLKALIRELVGIK